MGQLLADADLAASLTSLTGLTTIVDASGRVLGYFQPGIAAPPGVARALSPHTDEELRELRKQRDGGLPLSEVLKRIGAR